MAKKFCSIQDQNFNSFPGNVIKLSFNKTKWTGLLHIGPTFSFFRLLFEYLTSGPKSYLDFRETRHGPRCREKQRAEHHGKNAKRALAKAGAFWAVRGQNKNCHTMLRSNSMLSPRCCLFSLNQNRNPTWFSIIGFTRHLVFKQAVIESLYS